MYQVRDVLCNGCNHTRHVAAHMLGALASALWRTRGSCIAPGPSRLTTVAAGIDLIQIFPAALPVPIALAMVGVRVPQDRSLPQGGMGFQYLLGNWSPYCPAHREGTWLYPKLGVATLDCPAVPGPRLRLGFDSPFSWTGVDRKAPRRWWRDEGPTALRRGREGNHSVVSVLGGPSTL